MRSVPELLEPAGPPWGHERTPLALLMIAMVTRKMVPSGGRSGKSHLPSDELRRESRQRDCS